MLHIPQAFYKICLTPCLAKVNLISSKSLWIVPLKGTADIAARSHQLSLVQPLGMRLDTMFVFQSQSGNFMCRLMKKPCSKVNCEVEIKLNLKSQVEVLTSKCVSQLADLALVVTHFKVCKSCRGTLDMWHMWNGTTTDPPSRPSRSGVSQPAKHHHFDVKRTFVCFRQHTCQAVAPAVWFFPTPSQSNYSQVLQAINMTHDSKMSFLRVKGTS